MYDPSARQRRLALLTLASVVLAGVLYGVRLGRAGNAFVAVAVISATWLLYIHGQRRGGDGDGGDDRRRRREKEMEAEVGGSGGHF